MILEIDKKIRLCSYYVHIIKLLLQNICLYTYKNVFAYTRKHERIYALALFGTNNFEHINLRGRQVMY
jgi:hypothetical protein